MADRKPAEPCALWRGVNEPLRNPCCFSPGTTLALSLCPEALEVAGPRLAGRAPAPPSLRPPQSVPCLPRTRGCLWAVAFTPPSAWFPLCTAWSWHLPGSGDIARPVCVLGGHWAMAAGPEPRLRSRLQTNCLLHRPLTADLGDLPREGGSEGGTGRARLRGDWGTPLRPRASRARSAAPTVRVRMSGAGRAAGARRARGVVCTPQDLPGSLRHV